MKFSNISRQYTSGPQPTLGVKEFLSFEGLGMGYAPRVGFSSRVFEVEVLPKSIQTQGITAGYEKRIVQQWMRSRDLCIYIYIDKYQ